MTADQAFKIYEAIIIQVQDPSERILLEKKILGAVESFEKRIARISARLDKKERYQIKKPSKKRKTA